MLLTHKVTEHPISLALTITQRALIMRFHFTVGDRDKLLDEVEPHYGVAVLPDLIHQIGRYFFPGWQRISDREDRLLDSQSLAF